MHKFSVFILIAVAVLLLGAQERQSKLAVMEIEDQSGKLSKKLLETAAEALRTEIGATNKFVLISKDRQRKAMIKGQKKESWKECYDQSCRIELGQALTADRILTGIVTLFGGKYTLTAELIDLAKEATVKTAKAEFDGTEEGLAEAIKSIAAQIAGKKTGGSSFKEGKIGEQVEEWEIGQGEETIVKFESEPTGATVRIDGKLLCQQTPCSKMLTQGKHEITLELENYLAKTKVGEVKKGTNIRWKLEPDFGYLSVTSEPAGIEVLLDGKSIGKTPVEKVTLSPGAHQVETSDGCYYQTGEKFTTKRGESKNVRLDIKPKEAGIKVTAQDKDGNDLEADMLVDGKKNIGPVPGTYKVPLCAKELVVKSKAGQYKQRLSLEEKKVTKINAVLEKSGAGGYDIKDNVVIDEKTSLMWQRERASDTMDYQKASDYCESLSLDGYSDWRLPSISELKTLIVGCQSGTDACKVSDTCLSQDKCRSDACSCESNNGPAENGYYWQKGIWQGDGNRFWSSSVRAGTGNVAWTVDFNNAHFYDDPYFKTLNVRCIRGLKSSVPSKIAHYEVQDNIVVDKKTGLMWQRKRAPDMMYHWNAINYCESLSFGGYNDWRLPSISELKTLIIGCRSGTDVCKVNDTCLSSSCDSDSCFCKSNRGPGEGGYYWQKGVWQGGGDGFWSSSVLSDQPDAVAWYIVFSNGSINNDGRAIDGGVRCVRDSKSVETEKKEIEKKAPVFSKVAHYEVQDNIVVDKKTGLVWQRKKADDKMNHSVAIEYCQDLSLEGYNDWRLPSISELKTLIVGCQNIVICKVSDTCISDSCYDDSNCHCRDGQGPGEDGYYWQKGVWQGGGNWFWSSSVAVLKASSQYAWGVGFGNGDVYLYYCSHQGRDVRCVRKPKE